MTNLDEMLRKLAQIGHESAECAFGEDPEGLPPAKEVWSFLLCNCGEGDFIDDPALDAWMEDSAPETMPADFGVYYAEYANRA